MRRALLPIVCCLVLSLAIQNTCPFGAAGKSSVLPKCGHCPLMRHCSCVPTGQTAWAVDKSPNHFPLFLFTALGSGHSFRVDMLSGEPPFPLMHYVEAVPDRLLKPPNA